MLSTETKICTNCNNAYPVNTYEFTGYVLKDGTRQRKSWCKPCMQAYRRQWKKTPGGRASQKRWRQSENHKTYKRAYQKRYADTKVWQSYLNEYRQSGDMAQAAKRHRKSDKGRLSQKLSDQRRRARKANSGGDGVTKAEWKEILLRYNHRCAYCGDSENITMDHVVPLFKGGPHSPENIVPACLSCNCRKRESLGWKPRVFPKDIKLAEAG